MWLPNKLIKWCPKSLSRTCVVFILFVKEHLTALCNCMQRNKPSDALLTFTMSGQSIFSWVSVWYNCTFQINNCILQPGEAATFELYFWRDLAHSNVGGNERHVSSNLLFHLRGQSVQKLAHIFVAYIPTTAALRLQIPCTVILLCSHQCKPVQGSVLVQSMDMVLTYLSLPALKLFCLYWPNYWSLILFAWTTLQLDHCLSMASNWS